MVGWWEARTASVRAPRGPVSAESGTAAASRQRPIVPPLRGEAIRPCRMSLLRERVDACIVPLKRG